MAQFKLFIKYLNTRDYDSYNENYRFSSIELDAENSGHYDAELFFYQLNKRDLINELKSNRTQRLEKRNYYAFMYDERKIYRIDGKSSFRLYRRTHIALFERR